MAALRTASYPFFDHPGPLAMAHRGGAAYAPNVGLENSLTAFANAVDAGYRYLETDVHASRDGALFAFHDATLDRVTGAAGRIGRLDAAVVRQARIGGQEPIPFLRELLEALPQARFNIDVKQAEAIAPLARLVKEMDCADRICVASFSTARLRSLRASLGPAVATSLGSAEVANRWFSGWQRVRPLRAPSGVVCAQVPHRLGRLTVATERFVAQAHHAGLAVHVWTVDDAADMERLLDRGVDGIITDRLDVLREVLQSRGQWVT